MLKKYYYLVRLIRIDQPIGIFLLLWPTLWGLWLSYKGVPDINILIVFIVGVLCMRSAGCIINDYIDCDIDILVNRTKQRPLSTGLITKKCALVTLLILLVISVALLCTLNIITIFLAFVALLLSGLYPYLKRYIYYPQIILGILFSWPILMVCTATNYTIDSTIWLLFIINVIWVVVYDTQYAMIDREDDKHIGVKSFAILFGNMDKFIIGFLQFFIIFLLYKLGQQENLSIVFYIFAVYGVILLFICQQILMYKGNEIGYFQAFLSNNYVGMSIFMGIAFSLY